MQRVSVGNCLDFGMHGFLFKCFAQWVINFKQFCVIIFSSRDFLLEFLIVENYLDFAMHGFLFYFFAQWVINFKQFCVIIRFEHSNLF